MKLQSGNVVFNKIQNGLENAIRRFRVRPCQIPFVIWFRERSGSTHLCSILNSHPQIACQLESFGLVNAEGNQSQFQDELLFQYRNRRYFRKIVTPGKTHIRTPSSRRIIQNVHDIFSTRRQASGFKFKYPIQADLYPEVIRELASFGSRLHVIILNRSNVIKQAISRQNMLRLRATKDYFSNAKCSDSNLSVNSPFRIDVKAVVAQAKFLARTEPDFLSSPTDFLIGNNSTLRVNYEDLLENEVAVIANICEFLHVDKCPSTRTQVKKLTPNNLSAAIENFDELQAAVAGTKFAPMVDEARLDAGDETTPD